MIASPARSHHPRASQPADSGEFSALCTQLRQVARGLDAMWRESIALGGSGRLTVQLGSASHSVHRALIALSEDAVVSGAPR
jgi:hypothetical protein